MNAAIIVNKLDFMWPDGAVVFSGLDAVFSGKSIGLIGNNGGGKSTLLKLISGGLEATSGTVTRVGSHAYLPQELTFHPEWTVARLLGIDDLIDALDAIEAGSTDERHYTILGDDWDIRERATAMLAGLGLADVDCSRRVGSLSGGEVMLVGLAGCLLARPDILLLDEPTNNLDASARERLYTAMDAFTGVVVVASHDRSLLERVSTIVELRDGGIRQFDGNLSVFERAIEVEQSAAERMVKVARSDMRRQKQELIETDTKLARRERFGKKMYEQKREPRAVMRLRKRSAQVSAAKLKAEHQGNVAESKETLDAALESIRDDFEIKIDLPETVVPSGRDVVSVRDLTFRQVIGEPVNIELRGPERVALLGDNGSGKTTFLRILRGELTPSTGEASTMVPLQYLSQSLDGLDASLSVFDNLRAAAPDKAESLLRTQLARFGLRTSRTGRPGEFRSTHAGQMVSELSGGERLRAALACVLLAQPAPQLLLLDEPTNNLDMTSTRQLEQALNAFNGALMVVSHDRAFIDSIGVDRLFMVTRGKGIEEVQ